MNDLETMLRESLQSMPMPEPQFGDPVAAVERRAARARLRIAAGGLAVVAIVVAAVVIPMQAGSRSHAVSPSGGSTPTSAPVSPAKDAPQVWFRTGSLAMASGAGALWHLHRDITGPYENLALVDRVDPVTHRVLGQLDVQTPADYIAYGLGRVWVWGGGDAAHPDGLLQSVDPVSTLSWTSPHQAYNGIAFADGRAWAATGRQVTVLDVTPGRRSQSIAILPSETTPQGIVATQTGQIWVRTAKNWLRLDPATLHVVDTVAWEGPMLGAAGGDAVWTYDGQLVALSPSLLHQGVSAAEGSRIAVPGPVSAVAASSNGGLFVEANSGPDPSSDPTALYFLSERALTGTAGINAQTPTVPDVSAYQLAPDGASGVNYTDTDAGARWVP